MSLPPSLDTPPVTSPALPPVAISRHALVFTGSGSEYFRIWIVNLLLMFLTLGLYYPWARVRKLQYFYRNTQVAGHALDFHGDPKQMLRGFLLMVVFLGLYNWAGNVSPVAYGVATLAFVLLWPALMRASLIYRLGHTSWRGLRFQFHGSLKGAYLVIGKPLAAMAALGTLGVALLATDALLTKLLGGLCLLGVYGVAPYAYYCLKRYQHDHYGFASLQTHWRATFGDVFKVFMRTGIVSLGTLLAIVVVGGVLAGGALLGGAESGGAAAAKRLLPLLVVAIFLAQFVPVPFFQTLMQNLLWNETGSRWVRFKSHLRFGALFRRTVLNWVLTVLTLGLYWPFAQIALARLKLEAITVHLRMDPDTLTAKLQSGRPDAAGDAALDLAGFDIGL